MSLVSDTTSDGGGAVRGFVRDYVSKTREFSRNANLYVVIGMDMIHGSFNVLFNLYLLALGFDIRFIGLRLVVRAIVSALTAVPAGFVSDRIGRKASFILGDGVGAVLALIMIHSQSHFVLLAAPAMGAFFSNLHHTSEGAFMMENSRPSERVHLFSIASSLRTLSAMAGMLLAGMVPLMFIDSIGKIDAYRYATYAGLGLWFLSLVPALMLRSGQAIEHPERGSGRPEEPGRSLRNLFSDIRHPRLIVYFVITSALVSFGVGAVSPLMNVVLHEGHVHANEGEIGVMFAVAELTLAVAMLGVPLLAAHMLKVDAIVLTRILSLPFVLAMGLVPLVLGEGSVLLLAMGAFYVGRVSIARVAGPLDDAFNMEVLDPRERATNTGFEIAAGGAMSAIAIVIASRMIDSGDFTTPFMIMETALLISAVLYWQMFRPIEGASALERAADAGELHTSPATGD
jgi:MFS family permease